MMHKLWIYVDSDYSYTSNKDFGANDKIELTVNVGTSSKNTKIAAKIIISRISDDKINVNINYK
jgi:hypothetical protein